MVHTAIDSVKRIRKEQGISQRRLAKLAGISHMTLTRIEKGVGSAQIDTIERLARALGVEVADLFPKAQASLFEDHLQGRTIPLTREVYTSELNVVEALGSVIDGLRSGSADPLTAADQLEELRQELRSGAVGMREKVL